MQLCTEVKSTESDGTYCKTITNKYLSRGIKQLALFKKKYIDV